MFTKVKTLAQIALTIGALGSVPAMAQENLWDKIANSGELNCAAMTAHQPVSWKVDGPAEYEGYMINICRAVAEALSIEMGTHITPKFIETSFATIVLDLQSGRIDIAGGGLSVTEERLKALDMPGPIYVLSDAIIYRKDFEPMPNWEDYNKPEIRVASTTGTSSEKSAQELMPNAEHLSFKNVSEVILAIQSGRADIFVSAFAPATTAMRDGAAVLGGMLLPEPRKSQPSSFGLRKDGDGRLRDWLQEWGTEARESGKVQWLIYDALAKNGFDLKSLSGLEL